jgi:signal transduction histidine kinase
MNAEDVGRVLSLISHEVRAPLGVMRGYLRLLEQQGRELSERHRRAVTAALRASERATELLEQVSDLARLQRRETTPALRSVPLEPLLRAAADAVSLPPDPIIAIRVGPTPAVSLHADDSLLRLALAGLISAVARAQPLDTQVGLVAHQEQQSGIRGICLTIAADQPLSYTRDERPLDLTRGGLGLVLPIAACVIEAHHGTVREQREGDRLVGVMAWLPLE